MPSACSPWRIVSITCRPRTAGTAIFFARSSNMASPYWQGILARCCHPLNTSVVEGINNTIKVVKRRAYGYRDEEYFFLKIRAAFPGVPR